MIRKCLAFFAVAIFVLSLSVTSASAYPTLQLDISGGIYSSAAYDPSGTSPFPSILPGHTGETIVATGNPFWLYAYLIPDKKAPLADNYYLSMALVPKRNDPGSLGSFAFNVTTINVTADMVYGVPPLEQILSLQGWDSGDLSQHGIFETYFYQYVFQFDSNQQMAPYNTADRAISGGEISETGSGMYYRKFNVDVASLSSEYIIHFDLYSTELGKDPPDIDHNQFAPFSHDCESDGRGKIPEPISLILLGSGLAGAGLYRRFRKPKG